MNNEEKGFIRQILAEPENDDLRLIYADWLDEQNDPRADFIRTEIEMRSLPKRSREIAKQKQQLHTMSQNYSRKWLAAMDRTEVLNCGRLPLKVTFLCELRWEDLKATKDPAVRHCQDCARFVYHCHTEEQAREHVREGHCIAIDSRIDYDGRDLEFLDDKDDLSMTMGIFYD